MTIGNFQTQAILAPVVGGTPTLYQFGTVLGGGVTGRLRWLNVNFGGFLPAQTGVPNLGLAILDIASLITYARCRVMTDASFITGAGLYIPAAQIFSNTNMNVLFNNGLQVSVFSALTGDQGNFGVDIGFDVVF